MTTASTSGVSPKNAILLKAFAPWLLECLAEPEPREEPRWIPPQIEALRRCPHRSTVNECSVCWKEWLERLGYAAQYEVRRVQAMKEANLAI